MEHAGGLAGEQILRCSNFLKTMGACLYGLYIELWE